MIKNGVIHTKDRWSLTRQEYVELVAEHEAARKRGDNKTMQLIEDHLEDINCHSECSALEHGNYEDAIKLYDEW